MITVDSNVFVYLYDASEGAKRDTARRVIKRVGEIQAPIGLQVVGEVQNTLRRKFKLALPVIVQAGRDILDLYPIFEPSQAAGREALQTLEQGKLSYWDALLVASARRAGCATMLTEDMGDGSTVLGVRIVSPFSSDGGLSAAAEALLWP